MLNTCSQDFRLFLILSLLICITFASPAQSTDGKKHVFVLHSYHQGLPWSNGLQKGIDESFARSGLSIDLHIEYLDSIRSRGSGILDDLQILFEKKFSQIEISAIVVTDDPALNFILERRGSFLTDVPVFFCGPNGLKEDRLEGLEAITGIAENPDMFGTLELVKKLYPRIEEIALVADRGAASLKVIERLKEMEGKISGLRRIKVMTNESLDALIDELNELPPRSPVLFHAFMQDRSGKTYGSNLSVLQRLSKEVDHPFYTFKKIDVGNGAVGGSVISEELMASMTAHMVVDYLKGKRIDDIAPLIETPQVYIFDAQMMKRFKISEETLPSGSLVINRTFSFYRENIYLVWTALSIFTVMVLLITFLTINVQRRVLAEKELMLTNRDLEKRVKERTEDFNQALVKAEAATSAKSDFLANISHEIRTPMNAIIGMSHLISQTPLEMKQKDYVSKISRAANNLLNIINDILDFSKVEAGKFEIQKVAFKLDDVMANLADLNSQRASDKGLELLFRVNPRVPVSLIGDDLRLGQILLNLVSNAVKFTEQGEILVSVDVVRRVEEVVSLKFSVRDSGIGMTEEQISGLFQSFSQADASTTRKYGGTGLGLALSKQMLSLMDGTIDVESEPGTGSLFYFTLPFEVAGISPAREIETKCDLSDLSVLIIDDNKTSSEILRDYLDSFGFKSRHCESAEAGIELIIRGKDHFDLVLMDYKMPGMDGIKASRIIKDREEGEHVPMIIMVTAYGRDQVMRKAEDAGVDGFLVKPVTPSILYRTIESAFGGERVFDIESEDTLLPSLLFPGKRVLVAEDNDINQQVARELLEKMGFSIEIVENGELAFQKSKSCDFDLVFMDIQMPVMNGYDSARSIREAGCQVPIIAMTANALVGDREKALDAGMNDYVSKPIDPIKLLEAIIRQIGEPESEEAVFEEAAGTEGDMPAIEGMDMEGGLYRMGGNADLYRELILEFSREYSDSAEDFMHRFKDGDRETARRLVHTIKGVSGNLGIIDLHIAADSLEKAVKEDRDNDVPDLFEKYKGELSLSIERIDRSGIAEESESGDVESVPFDVENVCNLLGQFSEFGRNRQPKPANETLKVLQALKWPEELMSKMDDIGDYARKYKLKEAAAIAEELLEEVKGG